MAENICENVAIIGASEKADRFSHKAFQMLQEHGHAVFPIHPRLKEIAGIACYPDLNSLSQSGIQIDTVTMYVRAEISSRQRDELISLKPTRVIFNPGTENPELSVALEQAGIKTVVDCTLVMLGSGRY